MPQNAVRSSSYETNKVGITSSIGTCIGNLTLLPIGHTCNDFLNISCICINMSKCEEGTLLTCISDRRDVADYFPSKNSSIVLSIVKLQRFETLNAHLGQFIFLLVKSFSSDTVIFMIILKNWIEQ